ncbi:type II toxin-antitoxin system HicB family antitoxin [Halorhabdus sp. BNX81]|uniref:type II toxin-antitoxin system HicB family antitoxin n=1 Tax=Halorhabdus sp. BNX81 TaxID=2980181 RepID=UPI0023DD5E62|nr:type II toxin-antitoxin system HicB family antitoxin [Halorhabdus sp. BNX81]WEL21101.1 hypothetical protein HBNXHr_1033 [Halorhabdus sp. BNX81]
MASSTVDNDPHDDEIHLWREDDWWIAKDIETDVTTQGRSREAALSNLDEAVALQADEVGHEPTNEELRELGIDPGKNRTGGETPPDVLE